MSKSASKSSRVARRLCAMAAWAAFSWLGGPSALAQPAGDGSGWRECAAEGEMCRVDNRNVVRYGADARWSTRVVSGTVLCGNEQFGDPAPDAPKRCYVRDYTGPGSAARGWAFCAAEGEICRVRGQAEVRFGSGQQFVTRSAYGQVRCDVESFGDPAYGVTKQCEVRSKAALMGPQRPSGNSGNSGNAGGYDGWGGNNAANDWRYCAAEGSTCLVNGRAEVRFGDGRRFATRTVSGDVPCEVQRFGDPARGVIKHCEVRAAGWVGGGSGGGSGGGAAGGWSRCAAEGERCEFSGQAQVRYGTQGRYTYRSAFNGLACETAAFGTDPYQGQAKACEVRR